MASLLRPTLMGPHRRTLLVVAVALSCVGCDQSTKLVARSVLPQADVRSLLGDTIRLQLTTNNGAFLGLGDTLPDVWRHWLLCVGVSCVLLGTFCYVLLAKGLRSSQVLSLALMLGGGASNLLDRLVYGGHVVDFINLGVGSLRTGIFNVADVAITSGVLLLLHSSRQVRQSR